MIGNGVELIDGPFDSETYANYINNSDIILIPYNAKNYFARSSGIFAESLYAGVPVIYPLKSWMGRELIRGNLEYSKKIKSMFEKQSTWISILKDENNIFSASKNQSKLILISYKLIKELPGNFIKINFDRINKNNFSSDRNIYGKENFKVFSTMVKNGDCFLAQNIQGNFKIKFELSKEEGYEKIKNLKDIFEEIDIKVIDTFNQYTNQVVGYGYDSLNDLGNGLIEVITNLEDYCKTSKEFSKTWKKFHSSENIVKIITSRK